MYKKYSLFSFMNAGFAHLLFKPEDETGGGTPNKDADEGLNKGDENPNKDDVKADDLNSEKEKIAAEEEEARKEAEAAKKKADETGDADAKKLAEEKAELLREVMKKKEALKEAQSKLEEYGDITPEKARELAKKEMEAEKSALEARGEFDRVKEMMVAEHKKEVDALKSRIEELTNTASEKDKTIDDLTVGSAFGNSKFIADDLILSPAKARSLYGDRFGVENGKVVAYDKPAGSKERTVMVDGNGNPRSFEDAFRQIIDADPDKDTLLKAKMKPGSASKSQDTKAPKKKEVDTHYGASRILQSLRTSGES